MIPIVFLRDGNLEIMSVLTEMVIMRYTRRCPQGLLLLLVISDETSRRWNIARNEWWARNRYPEVKHNWSRDKWSRTALPFIRGTYIEKRIFTNAMVYDFGTLQGGLFLSIYISHDSTICYGVYVTTEGVVSTRLPAGRPKYLASIPHTENKVSSWPQCPDHILFGIKNDTAKE
jgi:hypothetical protein